MGCDHTSNSLSPDEHWAHKKQHMDTETVSSVHDKALFHNTYKLLRLLGHGGFGWIYEAIDMSQPDLPRVALKVEQINGRKVFLGGDRFCLATMSGKPHFPRFFDFGKDGKYCFVSMELLGPSLASLLESAPAKKFSIASVLHVALQAVDALQTLHNSGIIHRDVKTSNLLIGKTKETRDTIYLVDFGLSKRLSPTRTPDAKTRFRGTPRYCSLNGHKGNELGRHDDLISLIYVIVELATGSLPWASTNDLDEVQRLKRVHHCQQLHTNVAIVRHAPHSIPQRLASARTAQPPLLFERMAAINGHMQYQRGFFQPTGHWVELNPVDLTLMQIEMQLAQTSSVLNTSSATQSNQISSGQQTPSPNVSHDGKAPNSFGSGLAYNEDEVDNHSVHQETHSAMVAGAGI
ncbi:putative Tau-tubulin kinase 1 [Blattamonas nauphoetae]|uniref:non-specific serine/threonine protein kinase n=1 Tax=Blattamonas nauphoetae TaxID=2049346 RepID=A0ABQ9YGB0_9EUKA|nr:putative Tau-tubulin kinase 1 [Blattamonas nauphoetae]